MGWKKDLRQKIEWFAHYCPHCPVAEQEAVVLVSDLEEFINNSKKGKK